MRPKEPRDSGQYDLLRARLDRIIDTGHALAKLARTVDWDFLCERLGAVYTGLSGRPPLPTRLMARLAILQHIHDLSDGGLCDRWLENTYDQYFCGEEFFRHKLPFDRSSIGGDTAVGNLVSLLQAYANAFSFWLISTPSGNSPIST
jgi:IS5 family transposase